MNLTAAADQLLDMVGDISNRLAAVAFLSPVWV